MAAVTDNYLLTSTSYRDLSLGLANCSFVVPFDPQMRNAIRLVLGSDLPAVDATNYRLIDPNVAFYAVNVPQGQDCEMHFRELEVNDRVYARAETNPVLITVYRK